MIITKDYLDELIDKEVPDSEVYSIYIDFEKSDIDIVPVIDSLSVTEEKKQEYKDAIGYFFELISNTTEFFDDIEMVVDDFEFYFKNIKFLFLDDKVEIEMSVNSDTGKKVLEDFFTKYEENFGTNTYSEVYVINVE